MALDVELKTNNGYERQNEDVALNAKLKNAVVNTKRKMVLDVELKTNNDSKCQYEDATLNAKMKMRI